jgi:RNA polymerase sigma-70 factor (ECF subfamily)
LPSAQRDAVMLRSIAGLDVAHVAAIMGKRTGTVRVLAHRGLRTLARRLADEERAVTP